MIFVLSLPFSAAAGSLFDQTVVDEDIVTQVCSQGTTVDEERELAGLLRDLQDENQQEEGLAELLAELENEEDSEQDERDELEMSQVVVQPSHDEGHSSPDFFHDDPEFESAVAEADLTLIARSQSSSPELIANSQASSPDMIASSQPISPEQPSRYSRLQLICIF